MRMADSAKKYVSTDEGKRLAGCLQMPHLILTAVYSSSQQINKITYRTDITDDQKKKIEDLKKNKAKDFDKDFAKAMVEKHEDAIKMYEKSANDATDADIKAYIHLNASGTTQPS
jgi:putative membrane protein